MATFIVECPVCNKPLQAATGLFAKKKIRCSCGYTLDPQSEKLAKKQCPHCGNEVVYDRAKSDSAVCPSCHNRINSHGEMVKMTCPACKFELQTDKNATQYTCPQCKTLIDVQARLAQEKSSGKTSIIKWDMGMNDIFVYRHPVENFNIGSQLIVTEGQRALFFRNGKGLDVFSPGRYTLETQKLPLLDELYKLPTDSSLTFDSRVYFIKTNRLAVKWGVPEIHLRNPGIDFYIHIGASGSCDLQVIDDDGESIRKLVYMIMGTTANTDDKGGAGSGESYTAQYISDKFRDVVSIRISDLLANIIIENRIDVLDIESKKIVISDILRKDFNVIFEEYGLVIPPAHFNITSIKVHNSEDVEKWKKQEADRTLRVREEDVRKAEAEAARGRILVEEGTEVQKKILRAGGEGEAVKITAAAESEATKLHGEGDAEAIRLIGKANAEAYSAQAIAEAEEMRAKGYTYAQETSRQIGVEAMKNGLPGTGGGGGASGGVSGALGDAMGLGISLGAMGSVMNIVKDTIDPVVSGAAAVGKESVPSVPSSGNTWNCTCGKSGITSRFCPDCGSKRPEPAVWDCPNCGAKELVSKFCPDCGYRKGGEQ